MYLPESRCVHPEVLPTDDGSCHLGSQPTLFHIHIHMTVSPMAVPSPLKGPLSLQSLLFQEPALRVPTQPQFQQSPGLCAQPGRADPVHGRRRPEPGLASQCGDPALEGLGRSRHRFSPVGPSCPHSHRSSLGNRAAANSPERPSHQWSIITSMQGWGPETSTDPRRL